MDKEKFCQSITNLLTEMFKREQELRDFIDTPDQPPFVKHLITKAELAEFTKFVQPYILDVVNSTDLDLYEFTSICKDLGEKRLEVVQKHQEWYINQEFDV